MKITKRENVNNTTKQWVILTKDAKTDLLLLSNLLDISMSHFMRSAVNTSINAMKEELFTTDNMLNEYKRWKASLRKPVSPEDFERVLQQKLVSQSRLPLKESMLTGRQYGRNGRSGRPKKRKD